MTASTPSPAGPAAATQTNPERADLLSGLGAARHFLRFTARDLTDEQARQRTTASELTLGGLIGTLTSSTITGNSATSTTASTNGYSDYGGGGLCGTTNFKLDNTIVSGNTAVNGDNDISCVGTVTSTYDAIGSTTGFTYTPGPGDLPIGANLPMPESTMLTQPRSRSTACWVVISFL